MAGNEKAGIPKLGRILRALPDDDLNETFPKTVPLMPPETEKPQEPQ